MQSEDQQHVEQIVDEEDSQTCEVNVIPVQLVQTYTTEEISSPSRSSIVRGKYYKQTYRPAWEMMPDFKGWLRGVEGSPTRAYCTYCQKTLHAHRLSLLKHTCTIRHQKAAQMHSRRKNITDQNAHILIKNPPNDMEGEEDEETEVVYSESIEMGEGENENEDDHEGEEDEDGDDSEPIIINTFQKKGEVTVEGDRTPISTNVVDSTRGRTITGLQVSLYKLIEGRWTYINEGITNNHGVFANFVEQQDFTTGRYKLHYDVDRYFEAKKLNYLFPFIEVIFDVAAYNDKINISVLLSPYGYTAYRS